MRVEEGLTFLAKYPAIGFQYRWCSRRLMPERWREPCRIVSYMVRDAGGALRRLGEVRVAFQDGTEVVAMRHMVRTARGFMASTRGGTAGAGSRGGRRG